METAIVLFVYNRPVHTERTINALTKNKEANKFDLIIYSDGPKGESDYIAVKNVRNYLSQITGFKSIKIIKRNQNFGLADSIINGVTDVLKIYDSVIVIEDDIVVSPFFLQYMISGLTKYFQVYNVASIHGYVYPIKSELPETFFIKGADCWGWGTWRRAWSRFNQSGVELLESLQKRNLTSIFDLNNSYPYTQMLKDQIQGKNNSWAIRWHASAFLSDMLTLYPSRSLVINIGNDASGVHSPKTNFYDSDLCNSPIDVNDIPIEESKIGLKAFENFFLGETATNKNSLSMKLSKFFNKVNLKLIIKNITPPFIYNLIKSKLYKINVSEENNVRENILFQGNFNAWGEAKDYTTGYDNDNILARVLDSTLKVAKGDAVYERDSVLFNKIYYSWPLLSALLLSASKNKGCLNVLDYGGSLGSTYFQNKKFLILLNKIKWSVIEQSQFVKAGKENIETEELKFYESIEQCIEENIPNFVLFSSVLQYLPNPYETIKKVIDFEPEMIVLDRTSFVESGKEEVLKIQHVPKKIYKASYPCWFLSELKIVNLIISNGYTLIESFEAFDNLDDNANWKGMIFIRANNV